MKHFMDTRLSGLRDTLLRRRHRQSAGGNASEEVLNTIENVVDSTDSKIRLVYGYRKKLRKIILSSLEFSEDLVKRIPKPLEVSSRTFASDPYVNAFFTNVTDLQSVFCHSSEVQDYLAKPDRDDAGCCALLCMQRSEKTVLGMSLSGDVLNRDVLQIAVNFSDHRIYSPAASEAEARDGLKHCLFQGLVTQALERIASLRFTSHRLQSRHQMLHARLRRHKQKIKEVKPGSVSSNKISQAIKEAGMEMKNIEQQILNTPLMTPQAALEQLMDVFSQPDKFVSIREIALRLNKMCIKINDDSPESTNKLNLIEATIGNEIPRVITLAQFPKKELIATTAFPALQRQ